MSELGWLLDICHSVDNDAARVRCQHGDAAGGRALQHLPIDLLHLHLDIGRATIREHAPFVRKSFLQQLHYDQRLSRELPQRQERMLLELTRLNAEIPIVAAKSGKGPKDHFAMLVSVGASRQRSRASTPTVRYDAPRTTFRGNHSSEAPALSKALMQPTSISITDQLQW